MATLSNCWIEAHRLGAKLQAEVVHVPTVRDYSWPCKVSHAFVRLPDGTEIEFVPLVCIENDNPDALGRLPWPVYWGDWRVRHG